MGQSNGLDVSLHKRSNEEDETDILCQMATRLYNCTSLQVLPMQEEQHLHR